MGKFLRVSLQFIELEGFIGSYFQKNLAEIRQILFFSQKFQESRLNPVFNELLHEFHECDKQNHQCLARLLSYRERWQKISDFRRRSGQVVF